MKNISKTQFKALHGSGELQLIQGGIKLKKEDVYKKIKENETKIHEYLKPVSNYGNIESDKSGYQECKIYISECENYIFVEHIIDNSKCNTNSWNDREVFTTAYLTC